MTYQPTIMRWENCECCGWNPNFRIAQDHWLIVRGMILAQELSEFIRVIPMIIYEIPTVFHGMTEAFWTLLDVFIAEVKCHVLWRFFHQLPGSQWTRESPVVEACSTAATAAQAAGHGLSGRNMSKCFCDWFGTLVFILPYIGNNTPLWLIFFRGVGIPPTSFFPPSKMGVATKKSGFGTRWGSQTTAKWTYNWTKLVNEFINQHIGWGCLTL